MKIQTLSIIAGTAACNATCPFCISKMTGVKDLGYKPQPINWYNFNKACGLAKASQVTNVIITGKGEPFLFPEQITQYLEKLAPYQFPIIELQTNGILMDQQWEVYKPYLKDWYQKGLSIIGVSITHYDPEKNKSIFIPNSSNYIDLKRLTNNLHSMGFTVRFACTMLTGHIDTPIEVKKLIDFTKECKTEQLSLKPVVRTQKSESSEHYKAAGKFMLKKASINKIRKFLEKSGTRLVTYGHGSVIYDFDGQNVCLTNCLTIKPQTDDIRQAIFFPDGHIRFDWQYKGAIIL